MIYSLSSLDLEVISIAMDVYLFQPETHPDCNWWNCHCHVRLSERKLSWKRGSEGKENRRFLATMARSKCCRVSEQKTSKKVQTGNSNVMNYGMQWVYYIYIYDQLWSNHICTLSVEHTILVTSCIQAWYIMIGFIQFWYWEYKKYTCQVHGMYCRCIIAFHWVATVPPTHHHYQIS